MIRKYAYLWCIILALGIAAPLQGAEETLSGHINILNIDPAPQSGLSPRQRAFLQDDHGRLTLLELPQEMIETHGGMWALEGVVATVRGTFPSGSSGRFVVSKLELDQPRGALLHPVPTLGPQPQITILLRYADVPVTPKPLSYFEGLMLSNEFPGLNHFLKEISYNNANVDGSVVLDWIDLPEDWDHYNWDKDENGWPELDLDRVVQDFLPLVDPYVHFPSFKNIILMFNDEHSCNEWPCGPWAGATGYMLSSDGQTKEYGMQFFGPFWFHIQAAIAHEMMHTFGVHHSGPLVEGYEPSHWDVTTGSGICAPPHPVYGCLAVYTLAWNMVELGWMPAWRCYNTGTSGAGIITIERLAFPPLAGGTYGMAKLWVFGSSEYFYSVEYRTLDGWDGAGPIPGQAVVLHRVETGLEDLQAQVVDYDHDGDVNDEGAMWVPGETYLNTYSELVVHVESWSATRAVVSVSNKARELVYVNWGTSGYEDGSVMDPWNTVEEGYASVHPGGTVYIFPGSYDETLTLSKPCTLVRSYGTEPVIIGQ